MKDAKDLIPWKVTDISFRPYEFFWSFNPSIHFDGTTWRCVLRCANYCMPGGQTIRSKNTTGQQTKNAMVILDPATWKPIQIFKMAEKDDHPRAPTPHSGYEDMRLFSTDKGGLQGICASLHLQREARPTAASETRPQHQPPEQVIVSFDDAYNIVSVKPIRGDGFSGTAQKNWVPFDRVVEPRFLYSIDKGTMFDDRGRLHGDSAVAKPSTSSPLIVPAAATCVGGTVTSFPMPELTQDVTQEERRDDKAKSKKRTRTHAAIRGSDVTMVRGGRIKLDTSSSRPSIKSARSSTPPTSIHVGNETTRMMGSGKMLLPTYEGLRGGTQLVRVGDDAWLGIGHEMKFVEGRKFYWHTFYSTNSRGKMVSVSGPVKLVQNGIEFAAGMAIDGDRLVVSFGVDDMNSMLGETRLSAVLELLKPV